MGVSYPDVLQSVKGNGQEKILAPPPVFDTR